LLKKRILAGTAYDECVHAVRGFCGWPLHHDARPLASTWDYALGANTATPLIDIVDQKLIKLDEPLGALDAKARKELHRWLRRLHDEAHIASVFVTHDQEEAMEVSDRVVLMNAGRGRYPRAPGSRLSCRARRPTSNCSAWTTRTCASGETPRNPLPRVFAATAVKTARGDCRARPKAGKCRFFLDIARSTKKWRSQASS
jgi:hypothetical protein